MSMLLSQAETIIEQVLVFATAEKVKPLAVMVLDAGGHPVAFKRQDKASLFRHDIAKAKALTALGMGSDTRTLAARAANNPVFFNSLSATTNGNLVLAPGGVLIRDAQGELLGAIGISGDTGDIDEACALAGIEGAGLAHGGQ